MRGEGLYNSRRVTEIREMGAESCQKVSWLWGGSGADMGCHNLYSNDESVGSWGVVAHREGLLGSSKYGGRRRGILGLVWVVKGQQR